MFRGRIFIFMEAFFAAVCVVKFEVLVTHSWSGSLSCYFSSGF